VANSISDNRRDRTHRTHRTRRSVGRTFAGIIAVAAAGTVSFATVSAHHIVSTTPTPSHGVAGTTALSDTALVYADSSRHIAFQLWAPNTCGVAGAAPVFTDSEAVTSSTLADSTVTSATYVPEHAGIYEWTAEVVVNSGGTIEDGPTACTDEQVTVDKVATHINTTPSDADGGAVGSSITDSATLSGGLNPTGTVTFFLYGPDNTACQNGDEAPLTWLQRWVVPVTGDGTATVPAPGYTTTATGTYNWVANYGGDSDNMPAHSACGTESVVMGKATPTIVTVASNGGPVGTKIHDTAQVTGGANPTGTVTFHLFSPSNPTCSNGENSGGAVQTVKVPLGSNGSATSAGTPYTTTEIGTYNWIATYNGDANNMSVSTACTDEQVTVGTDPTSVATVASAGGAPGVTLHDTATVTGAFLPTGTVTFSLYGPTDATCTGTAIFTSTVALSAGGTATSASFSSTSAAGTYNWVAAYSGDARSAPSTSKCGAEPVHVTASSVKGITTPGTGLASSITQIGVGIELMLGGLALFLGSELVKRTRRA
jgi:hypothetical protein